MLRLTSGTTAIATTSNTAVSAIAASELGRIQTVRISNEGVVVGWFSIDGGTTYHRLTLGVMQLDGLLVLNKAIMVKRVAGGTNLSDVYVDAWGL